MAKMNANLSTILTLNPNNKIKLYNINDGTLIKSVDMPYHHYPFGISSNAEEYYYAWGSNGQIGYGKINLKDSNIESSITVDLSTTNGDMVTINSVDLFTLNNDSLIIPYSAYIFGIRHEEDINMSIAGSYKRFYANDLLGFNYNKNLIIGTGNGDYKYTKSGGDEVTYIDSTITLFDNQFNIYFRMKLFNLRAIAVTKDTNMIGIKGDSVFKINKNDNKIISHPIPHQDDYIASIDTWDNVLLMKNDKFLILYDWNNIKLVHAETGFVLDSIMSLDPIYYVSNLDNDNEFVIVNRNGKVKFYNIDSSLRTFKADFFTNKRDIIAPESVHFYPYNDLNVISYKWYFGDGTTSTEKEPDHIYTKQGVFDVSLEISDGINVVKKTKTEFISAKGIKFDSKYSIDTLWVKNYQFYKNNWISYNNTGSHISFLANNSIINLINSENGKISNSKNLLSDMRRVQISADGKVIAYQQDQYTNSFICVTSYECDSCFSKIQMNHFYDLISYLDQSFYFLPLSTDLLKSEYFGYKGLNAQGGGAHIVEYNTKESKYITLNKENTSVFPSFINNYTSEIFFHYYKGYIVYNPISMICDTLLLNQFNELFHGNMIGSYLLNRGNDILFITEDSTLYIYSSKNKILDRICKFEVDYENIECLQFVEYTNNVIILRKGGQLDILDYVKNEIVDHAEIPAEFIGLSVNPKSGEFATLSDDGKVIVWKTKNIPMDKYEEPIVGNQLTVYPNPAGEYINIDLMLENNSVKTATVYSPLGNKLIEVENQTTIDIRNLDNGIYFVKVGNRYAKFVKM